jgi:hypothetical protein
MYKSFLFVILFLLNLSGCNQETGDCDSQRGELGKADQFGSCAGTNCDGKAPDGNCYCDNECHNYNDCCEDKVDECGGLGNPGESCTLSVGCVAGSYCHWSGQGVDGTCQLTTYLYQEAVSIIKMRFATLSPPEQPPAKVYWHARYHQDGVTIQPEFSYFAVDTTISQERSVRVIFDVSAKYKEIWRIVPEDIRNTAPWGNMPYITLGEIAMTLDGSMTLDNIIKLTDGVVDSLDMHRVQKSSDNSMIFFRWKVPELHELEIIHTVQDSNGVIEAWPNRIIEYSHSPVEHYEQEIGSHN